MTLTPAPTRQHHPAHIHHDVRERVESLLADISHPQTLNLAEEMLELLATAGEVSTQNLTLAEVSALERVGVAGFEMTTPASVTPLVQGRLTERTLEDQSYSANEVARLLDVTPTRVRQRAADGSLIARRLSNGWHFPAFQFTVEGELPGWNRVARVVTPGTPLTLVNEALHTSSSILGLRGEDCSVAEWLTQGGDVTRAADALDTLLNRMI